MSITPAVADSPSCPHDRGPGTTICLRCRADTHRTAAAARQRVAIQAGIAVVCVAVVVAIGTGALASRGNATAAGGEPGVSGGGTRLTMQAVPAPAATPGTAGTPTAAAGNAPLIADGRTELGGGTYAVRAGQEIVVHFDTPLRRTRHGEKFERVVRETLPAVYGTLAQQALDAVPYGSLIAGDDLLTELPARGVTLPARDGIAITVYPGTRAGQDGPLAVRYRVAVRAPSSAPSGR